MGKGAYGEDAGRSSSRALLWAPHVCVRVCPGRLVVGLRLRARSPIPFPLPRAFFSAGTLVVGALASGAVRPPRVRSGVWVCVLWGGVPPCGVVSFQGCGLLVCRCVRWCLWGHWVLAVPAWVVGHVV